MNTKNKTMKIIMGDGLPSEVTVMSKPQKQKCQKGIKTGVLLHLIFNSWAMPTFVSATTQTFKIKWGYVVLSSS